MKVQKALFMVLCTSFWLSCGNEIPSNVDVYDEQSVGNEEFSEEEASGFALTAPSCPAGTIDEWSSTVTGAGVHPSSCVMAGASATSNLMGNIALEAANCSGSLLQNLGTVSCQMAGPMGAVATHDAALTCCVDIPPECEHLTDPAIIKSCLADFNVPGQND